MRKGNLAVALAVLALAGLLVPGCGAATEPAAKPSPTGPKTNGLEKLSVDKVIEKATKASADADTVHMAGSMKEDDTEVELDMKVKKGEGSAGQVLFDGLRVDIIRIDKDVYFKGSKKFWTKIAGGGEIAAMLAGKWIKSSLDDESMADLAKSTDTELFLEDALDGFSGAKKGKPEKVDGQLALPLIGEDDEKAFIALTGEPRILKIVGKGDATLAFTYDEPVEIKAPPADEVFDPDA